MGLTMSDEDEREYRELAQGDLHDATSSMGVQLLLAELDATRAALAEAERELSMRSTHAEVKALLAAREADNARLREALRDCECRCVTAATDLGIPATFAVAVQCMRCAALAQQPEQAALRAMLERVAAFAWDRGWDAARDGDDATIVKRDVSDAVDSILRDGGAK